MIRTASDEKTMNLQYYDVAIIKKDTNLHIQNIRIHNIKRLNRILNNRFSRPL